MKYSILFQIKRILFRILVGEKYTYIPMTNKLMNTTVIGANMGFGKLPHPSCGSIHWGCQDLLRRVIWIHWWKIELDHNRHQSSNWPVSRKILYVLHRLFGNQNSLLWLRNGKIFSWQSIMYNVFSSNAWQKES